jgi:hypothetical protein
MSVLRSRTVTVSIDTPPARVYEFAGNPENFPQWTPSFVRAVRRAGDGWILETRDGELGLRFVDRNPFGVLDHYVTVAGVEILVPMRVVPNGSGSEVMLTLVQTPDMSDATFAKDAAMIDRDLLTLKTVLERPTRPGPR